MTYEQELLQRELEMVVERRGEDALVGCSVGFEEGFLVGSSDGKAVGF
jgi:hypothetical protein